MTQMYSPEGLRTSGVVELESPRRYWYLLLVAGVMSVVIGVLVLAYPRSLEALCVILGIYLLAAGVLLIVQTVSDQERGAGGLLLGILSLIAGIVVIRHPSQSLVAVALAVGLYFLVVGALDLARAITGPRRLSALLHGIIGITAAVIILASPHIGVTTLAILAGIALCLHGAFQIVDAFALRGHGPAAA